MCNHAPVVARVVLLAVLCSTSAVGAAEYQATPANYRALLAALVAGDTLMLAPGHYPNGLPVHGLKGTPDLPIVIEGPGSGEPAVFHARPRANTVSIANSSYVTIRNLEVDGRGIAVNGVIAEGWAGFAHNITLENLFIHDHDANQQVNGISTKCPAWNWVIRNSVIARAGSGMYLGNSDGAAPFIGGLIERNLVMDTIGYNIQIKHQKPRAQVPGMPEQQATTIIRHNVFSKAAGSSTGELARPNLLIGHAPLSGPGGEDNYAIYANFFYQNPSEALFQGEGNFAFYSNVLVNTFGDGIHIQPHNAVPRRIDVFHNTVLAANSGIRIRGGDPAHAQRVIANAVFAEAPITGGEQKANKAGPLAEAVEHLANPNAAPGRLDLAPRSGKLTVVPFDLSVQTPVPELQRDFDGRPFTDPVAGAYAGAGSKWRLLVEPKR